VTRSFRILFAIPVICSFTALPLALGQKQKSPDDGMVLEVSTKKKKKDDPMTQTLPPAKEPPSAVVADTDRLLFQVSPLSSKGLLSQQTREAMKTLLRTNHGATIVKLRAFVAGSGDMRRIQDIAGEVFTAAHLNLPALSVVQAGALPLEGAQVVIESVGIEKKTLNENGVAFVSGQAGNSVGEALDQMGKTLATAGMDGADVLRVTCFVSSLESSQNARGLIAAGFPSAAFNYIQMQRGPVTPAAECEGVARLRQAPAEPVTYLSQMVLVHAPKVVFTGTQLGFGSQESDVRLAFDRLQKALASMNANLGKLAMSHVYLTSMSIAEEVRAVRKTFYNALTPPASTQLPFEALPSLDASFGVDVVAVPEPGV